MKRKTPITGEEIRKARKSLGDTQVQFAERIGIHQGTLSNWEAGKLPKTGMTQAFLRRVLDDICRVMSVRQ